MIYCWFINPGLPTVSWTEAWDPGFGMAATGLITRGGIMVYEKIHPHGHKYTYIIIKIINIVTYKYIYSVYIYKYVYIVYGRVIFGVTLGKSRLRQALPQCSESQIQSLL